MDGNTTDARAMRIAEAQHSGECAFCYASGPEMPKGKKKQQAKHRAHRGARRTFRQKLKQVSIGEPA